MVRLIAYNRRMIKETVTNTWTSQPVERRADTYPALKEIVLSRSAEQADFYPTPDQVRRLLRDDQVRGTFMRFDRGERVFNVRALLDALPLKTEKAKLLGYEQFLQIAAQKERGSLKGKLPPRLIFRAKRGEAGDEAPQASRPVIEIGGPYDGWVFKTVLPAVVQVNMLPLVDRFGRLRTEFIADPTNLPFPEGSLGTILGHRVHEDIWDEAERTLAVGGFYVSSGLKTLFYKKGDNGQLHREPPLGFVTATS